LARQKKALWLTQERTDLTFPHQAGDNANIQIAYCPERVLTGYILLELVNNNRIFGGMSQRAAEQAIDLYKTFVKGDCLVTTARTAELCKLTENAYRDVNITFANEISLVCEAREINVWELIKLSSRHPRVNILQPDPGVGGHFITCFGSSVKADIDDIRESPALDIAQELAQQSNGTVVLIELNIEYMPSAMQGIKSVDLVDIDAALHRADIVVGLVDHKEFKSIDIERMKEIILINTRGVWN